MEEGKYINWCDLCQDQSTASSDDGARTDGASIG